MLSSLGLVRRSHLDRHLDRLSELFHVEQWLDRADALFSQFITFEQSPSTFGSRELGSSGVSLPGVVSVFIGLS